MRRLKLREVFVFAAIGIAVRTTYVFLANQPGQFTPHGGHGKVRWAWFVARDFASAFATWQDNNPNGGECPSSIQELLPDYKHDLRDPWGSPFVMLCGDQAPPDAGDAKFGIVSAGPDRKLGTADDIHSWDLRPPRY
jgi:hypothetical protein